jgi:hypothetical protein
MEEMECLLRYSDLADPDSSDYLRVGKYIGSHLFGMVEAKYRETVIAASSRCCDIDGESRIVFDGLKAWKWVVDDFDPKSSGEERIAIRKSFETLKIEPINKTEQGIKRFAAALVLAQANMKKNKMTCDDRIVTDKIMGELYEAYLAGNLDGVEFRRLRENMENGRLSNLNDFVTALQFNYTWTLSSHADIAGRMNRTRNGKNTDKNGDDKVEEKKTEVLTEKEKEDAKKVVEKLNRSDRKKADGTEPEKWTTLGPGTTICFRCGENGHSWKRNPNRCAIKDIKVKCSVCGKDGHASMACFQVRGVPEFIKKKGKGE